MRWTHLLSGIALSIALSACSEGEVPHPHDAGSQVDGGADDAGEQPCVIGDRAVGVFGPRGGRVSLCGAEAELAPNVLTVERAVTLTVVALANPVPFPLAQAGLAIDIEVEGGVPPASEPPLTVLVPHEKTSRYVYFFRADESYQGIEACTVEEAAIGQSVFADGTYVALAETEDFPESRQGLGSGTVEANFAGAQQTYDLDGSGFDTYAIYDQDEAGARTFVLAATKTTSDDTLLIMRLTFAVNDEGTQAQFIEVTYGDLTGLYGYLPFDDGPAAISLAAAQGATVMGSFEVEVKLGDDRKILTGSFDASAQKYRYPPELSCGAPPEG